MYFINQNYQYTWLHIFSITQLWKSFNLTEKVPILRLLPNWKGGFYFLQSWHLLYNRIYYFCVKCFRSIHVNKLFVVYFVTVNGCISGSISLIGVVNYNWIVGDEISTLNFSPFFNPKLRPFLFSICLEQNEASLTSITSQTPKVRLAEDGISSTLLFFVLC